MKGELWTIVKKLKQIVFTKATALSLQTIYRSSFNTEYVFAEKLKVVLWI